MSWRDGLQPASFRGVNFLVSDTDVLFGRRNELHEYPLRDEPFGEDLGKKAREYTINAFVLGDNYFNSRDALIAAIEENDEPGTLIHPTLGTKIVIPKDCRVMFSNQEGNLEKFVLTFIEAGTNQFPSPLEDTQSLTDLFSTDAISAIVTNFASNFNVVGFPGFLLDAAVNLGGSFVTSITNALGIGVPDFALFSDIMELINKFSDNMSDEATEPEEFGTSISRIITNLTTVYADPLDAYRAQKNLAEFGDDVDDFSENTPSRIQQGINQEAFLNLVKNSAAVELIRITSQMDYSSRQDAIAVRDEVDEILEPRLLGLANAGNDDQYIAISKARAAMVKDINARGAKLADIITIRTHDEIPALLFAYNHYENANQDAAVITRNKIRHPLFIPPDTLLEVLV
jgi:prophage DNA circulation protein